MSSSTAENDIVRVLNSTDIDNAAVKQTGPTTCNVNQKRKYRKKERGPYNTRFSQENPYNAIPRTSKWRLKKNAVLTQYAQEGDTSSTNPVMSVSLGHQDSMETVVSNYGSEKIGTSEGPESYSDSSSPASNGLENDVMMSLGDDTSDRPCCILEDNTGNSHQSNMNTGTNGSGNCRSIPLDGPLDGSCTDVEHKDNVVYDDVSLMNLAAQSYTMHREDSVISDGDSTASCVGNLGHQVDIQPDLGWDFMDMEDTELIDSTCDAESHKPSTNLQQDVLIGDGAHMEETSDKGVPLYAGAKLTVDESVSATLAYCHRFSLSSEALKGLLPLIELHCPTPNECKKTLYSFRAVFDAEGAQKVHMICDVCKIYIGCENVQICPNDACRADLSSNKSKQCFFLEVSIEKQIEKFFKRKNFHKLLQHRFSRQKISPDAIEDIYDGSVYREHAKPGGFLNNPNNISFSWNTDGVPVFESSNRSLWPIYLVINELPYKLRMNPLYMIYAGLWCGGGKPNMATYLKPLCDSLQSLYVNGIDVNCGHCHEIINTRSIVLCGTCDLPARADATNMTYFNGKNGCLYCTQKGKVVQSGRGHATTYPFDSEQISGPLRTHEEFCKAGLEANNRGVVVDGIKGPTWLSCLPSFNIVRGTGIDYMHCVLTGTVKRLIHLWFDSSHHAEPYSLSKCVKVADSRILAIKPPHFISRTPRSIGDHLAYWKANECRAWLVFYSIPVLHGLLPPEYFQHHLLFVEAIVILSKTSISPDEVAHAERVLIHYCSIYAALYGNENMTMNIHNLLHLSQSVRDLGPLWVFSCFSFENVNGKLLKFIHGPNNPMSQISSALSSMLYLAVHGDYIDGQSKVSRYIDGLQNRSNRHSLREKVADGIHVLGGFQVIDEAKYRVALSACMTKAENVLSFRRASVHGITVCSTEYTLASARFSSVVELQPNKDRAVVETFLKTIECRSPSCVSLCQCKPKYYAVVRKFKVANEPICQDEITGISLPLMKVVHVPPGDLEVVSLEDIIDVCVYVASPTLTSTAYTFRAPNHLEGD